MEKQELQKLKETVERLAHVSDLHSRTLYGTDLDPGGIEKAVKNQTKMMWICSGVIIAVQFLRDWLPILNAVKE
jgi:hypothetical protein